VEGIEKSGVKDEALDRVGVGRRTKSLALISLKHTEKFWYRKRREITQLYRPWCCL